MNQTDPLIGTRIEDRYLIEAKLGEGGMGVVYRAVQSGVIDHPVAIKILRSTVQDDVRDKRFENEVRIIAGLRHPNSLRLLDAGKLPDGRLYVVTELLEGEPLSEIIRKEAPLAVDRTLHLIRQVCEALGEAHDRGVVHRDIKPGNIFVERVGGQEVVKLLDFGLARDEGQLSLTQPQHTFGTPMYMSPEQCKDSRVGPASDLYALGSVLLECLTGQTLFPMTNNVLSLMFLQVGENPVDIRERRSDLPEALCKLVRSLLDKSPEKRPASALVVRDALAAILAKADLEGTEPTKDVPPFGEESTWEDRSFGSEPTQSTDSGEGPSSFSDAEPTQPKSEPSQPAVATIAPKASVADARAQPSTAAAKAPEHRNRVPPKQSVPLSTIWTWFIWSLVVATGFGVLIRLLG